MHFAVALQGINNVVGHLAAVTQVNNTCVVKAEQTITWNGRRPGILKGIYYPLEYQYLLDRQQYSVLLADSSFFQFFFQFDDDELKAARLAYYPRPIATSDTTEHLQDAAEEALERLDEDLFDHLYNWTELTLNSFARPSNTAHLRFDYDSSAQSHSPAHLQFGGIQELRLPAAFVPQPLAFVQLCESLIVGLEPLDGAGLGFERNNVLHLERPSQLIALACVAAED